MENETRERPGDDSTEAPAGSRAEREDKPRSYYYDDGTGYEIYQPEEGESTDESTGDDKDA